MTSLSPVHTIGNQMIEAIRLHLNMSTERSGDSALSNCWRAWDCPSRIVCSTAIATSSAAGCASG